MSAIAEFLVSWFQSLFNLSLASAVVLRQWKAAFVTLSRRGNISQQSYIGNHVYRRIQAYTDVYRRTERQTDRRTDGETQRDVQLSVSSDVSPCPQLGSLLH